MGARATRPTQQTLLRVVGVAAVTPLQVCLRVGGSGHLSRHNSIINNLPIYNNTGNSNKIFIMPQLINS